MNSTVKHQLRRLINSMSRSEKRSFKLFAQRNGATTDSKFIQLFDLIDSTAEKSDSDLSALLYPGQKDNLSNLKRHLYQQLLTSLRLVHIKKWTDIEVRQQIDFARILYGKGHYLDALRILERTKDTARSNNFDLLLLEILEFQKLIEARHVTRSRQMKNKMDQLVHESAAFSEINLHTSFQSNVNIQIQGYYILQGHSRNEQQRLEFETFWQAARSRALNYPPAPVTFFEQINRHQASMWRYYIQLNLKKAQEAALASYNLFVIESKMPLHDPDLFIRTLYYVNALSFLTGDSQEIESSYQKIADFTASQRDSFNDNTALIAFVYQQLSALNRYIDKKDWGAAYDLSKKMQQKHHERFEMLPDYRLNLFRYKFAAIALANRQVEEALDTLQSIMNAQVHLLRKDLIINTRLLLAICYFENDDFYLADYALTNLQRMIRKSKYTGQTHTLTITALRQLMKEQKRDWSPIFANLKQELLALQDDPYEAKLLKFIDVVEWTKMNT